MREGLRGQKNHTAASIARTTRKESSTMKKPPFRPSAPGAGIKEYH
ncbi:MAG: hypothetical protein PUK16_04390 [Prevotellaceae bacterium]|nr:hypothetical protein [Prevotellaceae bacterium]